MPSAASFRSTTGVKLSGIRPFATSLPVVTTAAVFSVNGRTSRIGVPPCRLLSLPQLLLLDHERDDARAAQLITRMDDAVAASGGDHDFVNTVDRVQPLGIHQKNAVNVRRKLDFALFCLAFTHVGILTERTQPLCRVILVQKTRLQLPDVKLLLTHRKQHRNVLRGDDVALAEARPLAHARDDLRHVVAQNMADRVLGFDTFHGFSSSISSPAVIVPPSAQWQKCHRSA